MFSKHEVRFSNLLVVYRGPMMKESEGPLNRDKQFLCAPSIRVIFDSMIRGTLVGLHHQESSSICENHG